MTTEQQRRQIQGMSRDALARHQLDRMNRLLAEIVPRNPLYADQLSRLDPSLESLDSLSNLPLTTKSDIVGTDPNGWPANLTYPRSRYTRFHQTSGTRGRPLIVLDTPDDWNWWIEGWQYVLDAAAITDKDICMLAFSFGPFIGFWSAFDAAAARGCLVVPGGGLSTAARLDRIRMVDATCLFCTPTYALRMAEVADQQGMDLRATSIRRLIVSGEPGGSLPAVRNQIETTWDAEIIDHSGASEVGPWGFGSREGNRLFVNEAEFYAEFLDTETLEPVAEGATAELVLTTLGRTGCPVLRYRTGDLVRPCWTHGDPGCHFVQLEGGILGRADDMMIIRGINIMPSSIEQIVRGFPEVAEFRITATKQGAMDKLSMEVEDGGLAAERLADALNVQLGLHVDVTSVAPMSLPRFEAKARRFVDKRQAAGDSRK